MGLLITCVGMLHNTAANRNNLVMRIQEIPSSMNVLKKTWSCKKRPLLYLELIFSLSLMVAVTTAFGQSIPESAYSGMRWRQVGPFRAGWATVASGVPGQPNTYYFGGAGGGVWKTVNAGRTWEPLMQHKSASAVGALAVSLSNPKIIYVGTGQVTIRYDDMAGNGVYRSDDGGKTWENVGLKDSRHIGRILIDPKNPNRVLVAALGHAFGPNEERGVYLTTDGGKHWQHVLQVDDKTGAVDLAWDPKHPEVVYAAMWQMRLHPWLDYFQPQGGPGSGIYKSEDGGEHWTKVGGKGLPSGDLGRIGIAVAAGSGGKTVLATLAQGAQAGASGGGSGFYRSDDGGNTWTLLSTDGELTNNYFCRITVDPKDPNKLYVMGRSIHYSSDGGRHFSIVKGSPGGDDYHFLWINPDDPSHMITGADQGACVTVDGGKTWSSWYNQPTGQFYHIAVDDQFPYHIYSGQQDNGTVDISSRGPYGVIEERDWHPVGGDERDYMVPKPGDPGLVFGSGLGGHVSRFYESTRQVADVSPWPVSSYGAEPTTVKYRYTWITPLVFSPTGNHAMYFGSQVLFKSTDDGNNWQTVSPDLSGKKSGSKDHTNPTLEQAKDAGYGVIYCIAPSPKDQDVIWVGTDDGQIQVTTDGGQHWKNVTPDAIPLWGKISTISPSSYSTKVAYVAVDLHRLDRFSPLILKTEDGGKTWTKIDNGIPSDEYVSVVRADPMRQGLLYAGTNRSVYVSFNDGAKWQPLSLNFPTTWVRDLQVHNGDLIAGTQGRGIWVLDDLEPLREVGTPIDHMSVHLFRPENAWRLRRDENRDTPPPPSTPLGQNPPAGAVIDYWLQDAVSGPITLTIKDSDGHVVRHFNSEHMTHHLKADRYFQPGWLGAPEELPTSAGMHRFVWDLRYQRPPALGYGYSISAVWDDDTPIVPEGAMALPGNYTVTLTVNGKSYTQPLTIDLDPRVHVSMDALRQQLQLAQSVDSAMSEAVKLHEKIESALKKGYVSKSHEATLKKIADSGNPSLAQIDGVLSSLSSAVKSADAAPTQGQQEVFNHYRQELNNLVSEWNKVKGKR